MAKSSTIPATGWAASAEFSQEHVNVSGIHASGKFDGDPEAYVRYVRKCIAQSSFPSIVSTTEVQDRKKRRLLRAMLREDGYIVRVKGQHVMGLKRTRYRNVSRGRLRRLTNLKGFPDWRQMRVMTVSAHDIVARRPASIHLTHSPSGIELGSNFRMREKLTGRPNLAVNVVRIGYTRWGNLVARFLGARPKRYVICVGDMNMNVKNPVWRKWISDRLGAECAINPGYKGPGTLGHRFIDIAFIAGQGVRRVRAMPVLDVEKPGDVDHRAVDWLFQVKRLRA